MVDVSSSWICTGCIASIQPVEWQVIRLPHSYLHVFMLACCACAVYHMHAAVYMAPCRSTSSDELTVGLAGVAAALVLAAGSSSAQLAMAAGCVGPVIRECRSIQFVMNELCHQSDVVLCILLLARHLCCASLL